MDHDGSKNGFALDITNRVSTLVNVPVIASGGGGTPEHFFEVLSQHADAALAASIFHFKEISIPDLKAFLRKRQIPVR
jgi:cyclase